MGVTLLGPHGGFRLSRHLALVFKREGGPEGSETSRRMRSHGFPWSVCGHRGLAAWGEGSSPRESERTLLVRELLLAAVTRMPRAAQVTSLPPVCPMLGAVSRPPLPCFPPRHPGQPP